MRIFAICDSFDAEVGLRMSGMETVKVKSREEFINAFEGAISDKEIGLLVLTEKAMEYDSERVFEARHARKWPIMVTVPGGISRQPAGRQLLEYVSEAVGVKLY